MSRPTLRLRVLGLGFGLAWVVVLGRAAQLQLLQGAHWRSEAEAQRTEQVVLPARRGTISDRHGTPLAVTLESYHVGLAPNEIRDRRRTQRLLERHLGISAARFTQAMRKRWSYFHGPFSSAQVDSVRHLPGVHLDRELRRFYPEPGFARGVVGRAERDGAPASGLERVLDTVLRGVPGDAVVLKDRRGRAYESPARVRSRPEPGADVVLTLDRELQDIAQRALAEAVRETGAAGGDVVILEPQSGELLALTSRGPEGSRGASVFTSTFEPGSTAKVFAAAALLEAGLVSDNEWVDGEGGRWSLGYRVIKDVHPQVRVTLADAIKHSSNIGIAKFAERLTPEQQFVMLRAFGFGTPTGVEVPSESSGRLRLPREWTRPSRHSLAIGYELAVTPLQLALAYGALANDGVLQQPTLVLEIRNPDGSVQARHRPRAVRRVVSPDVARTLREWLAETVTAGSATEGALTQFVVAGKTGTARRVVEGSYRPGEYTASFVSLFPADEPQLVLVVKLDSPREEYLGGLTAAPVTREMLEQALAARQVALDRTRFATGDAILPPPPPDGDGAVTRVVQWPWSPDANGSSGPPEKSVVPRVAGQSLREAVVTLHRHGLRVRIDGHGTVRRTSPAAGMRVAPGTLVTLIASNDA